MKCAKCGGQTEGPCKLCEMFAEGSPPGCMTDAIALQVKRDRQTETFNRNPTISEFYKKKAKAAGVDTTNKVYMSSLANASGDPRAWVSQESWKGEARKICEERGWSCNGEVKVKGDEPDHAPGEKSYEVADKIIQEEIFMQEVERGEKIVGKERQKMTETLKSTRKGKLGQKAKVPALFKE